MVTTDQASCSSSCSNRKNTHLIALAWMGVFAAVITEWASTAVSIPLFLVPTMLFGRGGELLFVLGSQLVPVLIQTFRAAGRAVVLRLAVSASHLLHSSFRGILIDWVRNDRTSFTFMLFLIWGRIMHARPHLIVS